MINIYLKKQSQVIYDYEQYINQYLNNQKIEKKELDNECNYLIEQINEAKFTSKPTKEEIELIEKEAELEKLEREKQLIEQYIEREKQQKEINEIRLKQLEKIINQKNVESPLNKIKKDKKKNKRYNYREMFETIPYLNIKEFKKNIKKNKIK